MGSVNKVTLLGNLGSDPEVRTLANGGRMCKFRVATSEYWRDRETRESRSKTQWHNVVIFNDNLVRIAEQYLRKGSPVYLEGQLETRKWQDQSGADRFMTEVVLRPFRSELQLISGRDTAPSEAERPRPSSYPSGAERGTPDEDDLMDDIPF